MIDLGDMIIRISSKDSHRLERSINGGRTWLPHWDRQLFEFRDLMDSGDELLADSEFIGICVSQKNLWDICA